MTLEVFIFGASAMQVRHDRVAVTVSDAPTAAEVLAALAKQHPVLNVEGIAARLAVNHTFATAETPIRPGDEVALIALVCGG